MQYSQVCHSVSYNFYRCQYVKLLRAFTKHHEGKGNGDAIEIVKTMKKNMKKVKK